MLIDDASWVEKSAPLLQLARHRESRKAHQHVLQAEDERVSYVAMNYGEMSQGARDYRYAVAMIEESGEGMGVLRVWEGELFVGKRQAKALLTQDGQSETAAEKSVSSAAAKYYAAKTALGEAFGTRKTKQAIHSAEKNTIDIQQLKQSASTFINRTIDDTISRMATPLDPAATAAASEDQSLINYELLPPLNLKASRLSDIYPLVTVVPQDVMAAMPLSDLPAASDVNGWLACARQWNMHSFIVDRLRKPGLLVEHSQLLLILHWLLLFRQQREATLNDLGTLREKLAGPPAPLLEWMLKEFAEVGTVMFRGKPTTRYLLPSTRKDRLLNWICIIMLHLDEHRTNATILSACLQVTLVKISDHFRAIGATLERPKQGEPIHYTAPHGGRQLQVKYAQMTIPPVFPKPRRMKAQ